MRTRNQKHTKTHSITIQVKNDYFVVVDLPPNSEATYQGLKLSPKNNIVRRLPIKCNCT